MAKLIYTSITSLDGYIEDASGSFDWAAPDEEVHTYVNDQERRIGTYLLGRRLYETMRYWETADEEPDQHPVALDYARIWQAADKVVYSSTLAEVTTRRTTLERTFDPQAVAAFVRSSESDVSVGGAALAAQALAAGIVDEVNLYLNPVAVGSGKRALPSDQRIDLELVDQQRFAGGVLHARYRVKRD